jgi:septum formation protein
MPRLILASASPRRLDLLRQIGLAPDLVEPSRVPEDALPGELPRAHAERLAEAKVRKVAERYPDDFVLGADMVVACGRRILPKALDESQARACLELLSGRRHRVLGAVCAIAPGGRMARKLVVSTVAFRRLDGQEIDAYVASREWHDKAGGYAIQGRGAIFVRFLAGSYSNVVGLPLYETAALLKGLGFPRRLLAP